MRAEKSKMASKMAAIVRNKDWTYLVCNNFLMSSQKKKLGIDFQYGVYGGDFGK